MFACLQICAWKKRDCFKGSLMFLQIKKSYSFSFNNTYIMELWVLHAKWHLIPCRITVGLICLSSWLSLKSLWGFQLYCRLSECVWGVGGFKFFSSTFFWKQNKVLKKLKESLYLIFSNNLTVAHRVMSRSPCPKCEHQRQEFGMEHCCSWQAQVLPELDIAPCV